MNIDDKSRKRLGDEFALVAMHMSQESDPFSRLYWFSALYGETGRLLNVAWDPELSLLHMVLQATYHTTNARLQSVTTGGDRPIQLPTRFFESLTQAVIQLTQALRQHEDSELYPIMARLAELAYVTTGNGYYLHLKGIIKV